jgi:hypothetical protein
LKGRQCQGTREEAIRKQGWHYDLEDERRSCGRRRDADRMLVEALRDV